MSQVTAALSVGTIGLVIGIVSLGLAIDCEVSKFKVNEPTTLNSIPVVTGTNSIKGSNLLLTDDGLLSIHENKIDLTESKTILLEAETLINFVSDNVQVNGSNILTSAIFDDFVSGPETSTNNALTVYDGTSGKTVKNSVVTLSNAGVLSANNNSIDLSVEDNLTITATDELKLEGTTINLEGTNVNRNSKPILCGQYIMTAPPTNITSSSPSSIMGAGVGTLTIPANTTVIGDCYEFSAGGNYQNDLETDQELEFKLFWGNTIICVLNTIPIPAQSFAPYLAKGKVYFRTIGASATVCFEFQATIYTANSFTPQIVGNCNFNEADTTIDNIFTVRANWTTTDSNHFVEPSSASVFRSYFG